MFTLPLKSKSYTLPSNDNLSIAPGKHTILSTAGITGIAKSKANSLNAVVSNAVLLKAPNYALQRLPAVPTPITVTPFILATSTLALPELVVIAPLVTISVAAISLNPVTPTPLANTILVPAVSNLVVSYHTVVDILAALGGVVVFAPLVPRMSVFVVVVPTNVTLATASVVGSK